MGEIDLAKWEPGMSHQGPCRAPTPHLAPPGQVSRVLLAKQLSLQAHGWMECTTAMVLNTVNRRCQEHYTGCHMSCDVVTCI